MSGVGTVPGRERLGWWALALALIGALWLALASVAGAVCLGVAAYYAARPIHRSFRSLVRFEGLAALGSLSVLALPISGILAALAGITAREIALAHWLTERYEGVARFGRHFVMALDTPVRLFSTREIDAIGNAAETGVTFTGIVGTIAIHLFVACAIAFYLLRDDHRFVRWMCRRFGLGIDDSRRPRRSLPSPDPNHPTDPIRPTDPVLADRAGVASGVRPGNRRLLVEYCRRVDRDLERVFFGAAAGAIVTAAVGVLAYGLLGSLAPPALAAPYLQLGLAVGIGGLVPAIGRKLVYLSATAVLASVALAGSLRTLWFVAVFLVASLLVVERTSDRMLRTYGVEPRQYGGLMALACVLGVLQAGWYGVLAGPIVLVSLIQFGRVVVPALLGGARPAPTPSTPTAPTSLRAERTDVTAANDGNDPMRAPRRDRNRTRHRSPRATESATPVRDGGRSEPTAHARAGEKTTENERRPTAAAEDD